MKAVHFFKLLLLTCLSLTNEASIANKENATEDTQAGVTDQNVVEETESERELRCHFAHGLVVGDTERQLECCASTVRSYHRRWLSSNRPLNRYLASLKEWGCPQFETECRKRLFVYNRFTDLMYDYFCNYTLYQENCYEEIVKAVSKSQNPSEQSSVHVKTSTSSGFSNFATFDYENDTDWRKLISQVNPSKLTVDELLQPCIQVVQYDQEEEHNGGYQEVVNFGIPFCGLSWCGVGADALRENHFSLGNCLQPRCKTRVIVLMVTCGILGASIAIVNIIIMMVIYFYPHLRNSQAVYKISLAVADFLVGIIVLPLCIESLRRLVWTRLVIPESPEIVEGYTLVNRSLSENTSFVEVYRRAGSFILTFPRSYQYFAGFVTAVSIFVSVYSLAGAAFDRHKAISKPFEYKRRSAYKIALNACIVFWLVATIFGLLPIFIKDLRYVLILSMVFATLDVMGYILYSVSFFIPLVIVWIANLLIYTASKKHSKFRSKLTAVAQKKKHDMERRLAITLRLMVGTFTISTLPLLLAILSVSFTRTLNPQLPEEFSVDNASIFLDIQCITLFLLFANSLWNFFIYSVRSIEFRDALTDMFANVVNKSCFARFIIPSTMCFGEESKRRRRTSTVKPPIRKRNRNSTCPDESHVFNATQATCVMSTPDLSQHREKSHSLSALLSRSFCPLGDAKDKPHHRSQHFVTVNDECVLNNNIKKAKSCISVFECDK